MRCPDCNKFVAFDEDVDPEITSDGEASDGTYRVGVARILNCEECGQELKRGEFEIEHDFVSDLSEEDEKCPKAAEDGDTEDTAHEWEVESEDASNNDRTITQDRNGKPIKRARYMTTMRGVTVNVVVKCSRCAQEVTFEASDEMSASSMDESV